MLSQNRTRRQARRAVVVVSVGLLAGVIAGLVGVRATAPGANSVATRASGSTQTPAPGARVRFELVATRRRGATGAPRAEVADNLAAGAGVEHVLSAGTPGEPDLCNIGTLPAPDAAQAFYLWQVRALVRSVSPTRTVLEIGWHRSTGAGDASAVDGDEQTVTLEAGQVRILDYVRNKTAASPCASVQLQVHADPLPSAGVQPTLTYDVWLVHEGRGGQRSVHQRVSAPSGQPVKADLSPLSWPSSGRTDGAEPIVLKAGATLAAMLRADGTLDVSVRAARSVSCGRNEVRGEGEEEFRAAPGDTVSLLFPLPHGRAAQSSPGMSRPSAADRPTVDFAAFFAGTETSLYVRVLRKD